MVHEALWGRDRVRRKEKEGDRKALCVLAPNSFVFSHRLGTGVCVSVCD